MASLAKCSDGVESVPAGCEGDEKGQPLPRRVLEELGATSSLAASLFFLKNVTLGKRFIPPFFSSLICELVVSRDLRGPVSFAFPLSLIDGVDVDVGKGEHGFKLARRISSDMGRLLRRGATSYLEYIGVVPSGLALVDLLKAGLGVDTGA